MFQDITGLNIKTVLNDLAVEAIDGLRNDLVNVINASEADNLSATQAEFLDEMYSNISNLISHLEAAIEKPFLALQQNTPLKKASLSSMIQNASSELFGKMKTQKTGSFEPER